MRIKTWVILIISIVLLKCEEPINLNLDEGIDLLVVDGLITDQPGPYTIKLTRTSVFGTQDQGPFEKDAIITILDDAGNSEILKQGEQGEYQTDESGIRGVIGNSYWLTIKTADGEEYQSIPDLLKAVPKVDSIYAEFTEEPQLDFDGHRFFIDLSDPPDDKNYYRWSWESVTPITTLTPRGFNPLFCCNVCFKTEFDKLGFNVKSDQFINGKRLTRQPIHFAPYRNREDYMIRVNQYSLTAEAFEFWDNIRGQTESVGSIFDQPPTPIVGNIKNTRDSEKNALGYFGASAIVKVKLQIDRGGIEEPLRNPSRTVGEGDCRTVLTNTTVAPPPDWEN